MNRKRILRIVLICTLLLFILMQFKSIDTKQPSIEKELNFATLTQTPPQVLHTLKKACYDCHSFEVHYPWYSKIAPFSWLVENHIQEGISHLNFSEWGKLSYGNQKGLLQESIKELQKGEMPMWSYTILHPESKLSKEELDLLQDWLQQQTSSLPEDEEFEY